MTDKGYKFLYEKILSSIIECGERITITELKYIFNDIITRLTDENHVQKDDVETLMSWYRSL